MTPQEIFVKHEEVINRIVQHEFIQGSDQAAWGELVNAYQTMTNQHIDLGCSGCVRELIRMLKIHLDTCKAEVKKNLNFYTFPKQG